MHPAQETTILTYYLVKQTATQRVIDLYIAALNHHPVFLSEKQKKVWQFCLKHPWWFSRVDAALAWSEPYNNIRKKIFIVLSILETQPEYKEYFLPKKRNGGFLITLFFRMVLSSARIITGKIFLWLI